MGMYDDTPSFLTCVHAPKHKYEYTADPLTILDVHPQVHIWGAYNLSI